MLNGHFTKLLLLFFFDLSKTTLTKDAPTKIVPSTLGIEK